MGASKNAEILWEIIYRWGLIDGDMLISAEYDICLKKATFNPETGDQPADLRVLG